MLGLSRMTAAARFSESTEYVELGLLQASKEWYLVQSDRHGEVPGVR